MDEDEWAWERRADEDAGEVGDCGEEPSRPATLGDDEGCGAMSRDDDALMDDVVVAGGQILVPAC